MVASHATRRLIEPRSRRTYVTLALAACLSLVAAAAAAEIASDANTALPPGAAVHFQAPLVPSSGSTMALSFRTGAADDSGTTHPAWDPFDELGSNPLVGEVAYAASDPPANLPMEAGDAEDSSPANCSAADEQPLGALTINIQLPAGLLPKDHAAACWPEIAGQAGANPLARCWPQFCYHWSATCLAYHPLYFEEINLERHGYGCGYGCQPVVSGAHFFGSFLALPYLMAVDCPGECVYTLGHYRPGSCPPWRHHCPDPSVLGGLSEAGVITGLIFLIP